MKKMMTFLTAGSMLAIAAPAYAQDTNEAFTGPRAEVLIGYDQTRAGSTNDNDIDDNDDDQSIEGLAYSVGVGFDFAAGGALIGVEGEYMDSTADVGFDDGDVEAFGLGNVGAGRDFYVGARAGILATPQALIYVKGGYTNARFDVLAGNSGDELEANIDTDGYRVGAGAEYAIGTSSFVKLEYRYSNYSGGELDFGDADVADGNDFDVDFDRHQIVAGVGFRF